VLGPLRLAVDGAEIAVPGGKRRAVLALLASAAPRPVAYDALVDELWPGEAPASGRAALQSHVSRLRRHLGAAADRITADPAGYRLALEPGELDAQRLDAAVRDARARLDDDPHAALALVRRARAADRGRALDGLHDVAALVGWAAALDELRASAAELHVECALASGSREEALDVAARLAGTEPLRETATLWYMRALAAHGRAADALRVAHDFRQRLADRTGLDASPALTDLEHQLAAGTPARRGPPVTPVSAPPSPLIGRDAEIAGLMRLLASERVVTLVGTGGVGKTHLALEAARRARTDHDVALLELAPLGDGAAVVDVLAGILGARGSGGDVLASCAAVLASGRWLLVVDNCEHVLADARRLVAALVEACPELVVLATSRERLGLPFEQVCPVAPLPLAHTEDAQAITRVPAVSLFLDRARRVRPGFEPDAAALATVAAITRRLDGLPLALELAAGRLSSMTLEDLAARLDRALDLLGRRDADERHATLRAAIEWSYALLNADEQSLFRALAVFADGFDLATAERVAADLGIRADPAAALARLVDASMVTVAGTRYRMLHLLRMFGLAELDAAGERPAADARLLAWAHETVSWIDATLPTADEVAAAARLRAEFGNVRAAWSTARTAGDIDTAVTIVCALHEAASWRDIEEYWAWTVQLASAPGIDEHPRAAGVFAAASEASWMSRGDLDAAERYARRGLEVLHPGDAHGRRRCLSALADVAVFRGRTEDAVAAALDAVDGSYLDAFAYAGGALAAAYAGDVARARELSARSGASAEYPTMAGFAAYVAGEIDNVAGDWEAAERHYRTALTVAQDTGASFLEGIASVGLVSAYAAAGRVADALAGYRHLLDTWERSGAWTQQWTTLRNVADLLDRLGDTDTAARIRTAADHAPEAAAVPGQTPSHPAPPLPRDAVLTLARAAIARHLV